MEKINIIKKKKSNPNMTLKIVSKSQEKTIKEGKEKKEERKKKPKITIKSN